MKATISMLVMMFLTLLNPMPVLADNPSSAKKDTKVCVSLFAQEKVKNIKHKMVEVDGKKRPQFAGFTEPGVNKLLAEQSKVKSIHEITERNYFGVEDIIKLYNIARTGAWHVMLFGNPGAAKTELIEFMQSDLWVNQVHQMTSELELIGGLIKEDFEKGVAIRNYKGTLADTTYAFLDELEKASPATLAMLLRLINERKVNSDKVPLRTLVAATNASMATIVWNFILNGQPSTGPAFLNRFPFKARMSDMLPQVLHVKLEELINEKKEIKAMAKEAPELLNDEILARPPQDVDWDFLKNIANQIFELDKSARHDLIDLTEKIRDQLSAYTKETEKQMKDGELEMQYYPSAELSTRLRVMLEEVIRVSAMLDLLRSKNFNKEFIKKLDGKITLSSLSLWRSYSIFTTTGMGSTFFDFDRREMVWGAVKVDGEFMTEISADESFLEMDGKYVVNSLNNQKRFANSRKDEEEIQHMIEERRIFSETLNTLLKDKDAFFKGIQEARQSNKKFKVGADDFETLVEDLYQ